MIALFRAVLVWTIVLGTVVAPRLAAPAADPSPVVSQAAAYSRSSVVDNQRAQRIKSAQVAQAQAWSTELDQGYDSYQAQVQATAQAAAEAARVAALDNHPPPPAWIGKIITDAFSPLGADSVRWAMRVAWCESRYHPNSINTSSGASGLFQFLPSTWSGTPWHAQSPFDPVANAQAAAWLYNRYGPGRWVCQ